MLLKHKLLEGILNFGLHHLICIVLKCTGTIYHYAVLKVYLRTLFSEVSWMVKYQSNYCPQAELETSLLSTWNTTDHIKHYWRHETLLNTWNTTEHIKHYWAYEKVLSTWKTTEHKIYYWTLETLLSTWNTTEHMKHYWAYEKVLGTWKTTEHTKHYWAH